jgi:hypothetical protein
MVNNSLIGKSAVRLADKAGVGPQTGAMLIANLPELGSLNRQEIADIKILLPLLLFASNTDILLLIWL